MQCSLLFPLSNGARFFSPVPSPLASKHCLESGLLSPWGDEVGVFAFCACVYGLFVVVVLFVLLPPPFLIHIQWPLPCPCKAVNVQLFLAPTPMDAHPVPSA